MTEASTLPLELDAAGVRAYVLGSLSFRGASHEDVLRRASQALVWYRSLTLRGRARGVLFSWVYDLGYLLVEGDRFSFRSLADLSSWPDEERSPRLEYENRLLNGFLRAPSTRQAIEWSRWGPETFLVSLPPSPVASAHTRSAPSRSAPSP